MPPAPMTAAGQVMRPPGHPASVVRCAPSALSEESSTTMPAGTQSVTAVPYAGEPAFVVVTV